MGQDFTIITETAEGLKIVGLYKRNLVYKVNALGTDSNLDPHNF